jgi:hypothetical protein
VHKRPPKGYRFFLSVTELVGLKAIVNNRKKRLDIGRANKHMRFMSKARGREMEMASMAMADLCKAKADKR